ncbi:rhomboid-like protein [Streptomyces sp. NPDC051639]|uniref:rhomboid-like protein n=1 Tax=unclassified Streptomyces TaxID=2593676 RepID=UPI002E329508|nr:rhomboid-like protein [Streptomyces sp. NBC_01455]
MDRSTTAAATTSPSDATPENAEAGGTSVLDGMPRQRGDAVTETSAPRPPASRARTRALARARTSALRPWRLLPTPTGTPFTFGYAAVLAVVSVTADHAAPSLVHALQQGSSTDVAHLARHPVLVLLASALWIAGGVASMYAAGFVLVLTALERRIGGLRAAGVFLLGHVVATLATEVPVGLSVLAGHLPGSSLHRLDYGISFGVAASVGALAGLLTPWLRWPLLIGFAGVLAGDLIAFRDPMTDWGHLLSLAVGVSTWPLIRRRHRAGADGRGGRGTADPAVRAAQAPGTLAAQDLTVAPRSPAGTGRGARGFLR